MDTRSNHRIPTGWRPGQDVWLESRNYYMRSLRPEDVSEQMLRWWADPAVMVPLGRTPRKYTREALAGYLSRFDNEHKFLLGIFAKGTGLHIGWRRIYFDPASGGALNNIAIGDESYRGRGVNYELQNAVYEFVFYSVGVRAMVAHVYEDNGPSIRRTERAGYRCKGVLNSHHRGTDGVERDVLLYEMTERDWRATRTWFYSPIWHADFWNGARAA